MKDGEASRRIETIRPLLRAALAVGALAVNHVGASAQRRWLLIADSGAGLSVGDWIPWLSLYVLAGGLFGLAIWLPRRVGYRVGLSVVIGILPLLLLMYTIGHLGYSEFFLGYDYTTALSDPPLIYDQVPLLAFLIGLSIASGFKESETASAS